LSEQAIAGAQISQAAGELQRMVAMVSKAMAEQAAGMQEISTAAEGMRAHSEQTSKALVDQARTMRDMSAAAQNTARQIKRISQANVEHSTAAASLLTALGEIRRITDRNASGVKQTRGGTDDLRRHAQALLNLMDRPSPARATNGRSTRSSRT
jgi:methyl-accepting chemotaxis protein